MKTAVFPGSFDPITLGHIDIIERALPLFDKIIVAVGENAGKSKMFSLDQRVEWIRKSTSSFKNVEVKSYSGLTTEFCRKEVATHILRGLRNAADLDFEKAIAISNKKLFSDIETVFLLTSYGLGHISSTIVRDIMRNGGDYSSFVPEAVEVKG